MPNSTRGTLTLQQRRMEMADRDDYRGYGRPSGRYAERGEYGRERGDRDYGRQRGGRDDDRGFFERAGEEIRSWFGDDDDDHRERSRYQDRGRSQSYYQGGRERSEPWGGGDRGGYGRERPGGFGAESRSRFQGSHPHDEHYSEWRSQQLAELDRDYDEYRRENRDRFHSEFSAWRGQRQQQRTSIRQVREHMEVVGSDGQPVGTVDKVAGDRIILTKDGPNAGGHHHSIPCSWLQSVDERVTINKTAEQARQKWTDEETKRALFESEDQRRNDGPHILDRSFSGTYER
jgi:hypothetical protein